MKKLYTIEYYDYTGEDQKAYIKAESQKKAVDKLHSEYLVDGIWTINVKEIEQKKYKVRKAKKAVTTDKTRPTTNKTRHNTHKENKTMKKSILDDYIDTYVLFEKLTDYYTFGRGMVVYLHYKNERIEKRFSCVVEAMQYAIEREQAKQFLSSEKLTRTPYTKTGE